MKTKYYVDQDGNYLGGFNEIIPENSIEVSYAQEDAKQKWDGKKHLEIKEEK